MALNPEDMPIEVSQGDLVTRYVELGDMAIRHATLPAGTDMAPVLQGLPGDRCPSPHWGIVLTGSITIEHADGTSETAQAGQVYHWPAGHTGITEGGVTFIEVGPVGPMRDFSEHAKKLFSYDPRSKARRPRCISLEAGRVRGLCWPNSAGTVGDQTRTSVERGGRGRSREAARRERPLNGSCAGVQRSCTPFQRRRERRGRDSAHAHSERGRMMLWLLPCPDPSCGALAELMDRITLGSTHGPVEHVRTQCLDGHLFFCPCRARINRHHGLLGVRSRHVRKRDEVADTAAKAGTQWAMPTIWRARDLAPSERAAAFVEEVCESIVPYGDAAGFVVTDHDEIQTSSVGMLRVMRLRWGRGEAIRSPRLIRRSDPELCKIDVALSGSFRSEQSGRRVTLQTGTFTFVDLSRPHRVAARRVELTVVMFPRALLPLRDRDIKELTGVTFDATQAGWGARQRCYP